ncbi:MAG TPA: bifunctional UDP-sugar hydrolase/5'-nucleotidase [Bacteroidota bacterium]|nr:bifunctional UDP-sugar hydrolase/5'-nucleotidase [Bacteroidota bacterium]
MSDWRFSLASWACALFLSLGTSCFGQPKSLTILHTNDLHAAFVPHEALWVKQSPKPSIGGFSELAFTIDSIKRGSRAVLLLDAGDVMTGDPISDHVYAGAAGGALFEMMNRMGYDAWEIGNHDLDISQDNLRALAHVARFPTLCANITDTKDGFPLENVPYVIIKRGGLSIAVIGLMSQELYNLVNQNNLLGIRVLSPAETAQKYIDEVRPASDLVIALTHEGVADDSVLAANVHGLDVIVGGHSHTRLIHPKKVNGVLIVQAGANAENLGDLELKVDSGAVISFSGRLIPLWAGRSRPPSPVSALVDSLQGVIDQEYSEVIANLRGDWIRSSGQSAIGTFLAEAQRVGAGADVGFMNDHGIRRDVPAGPLTKKTVFEIIPFRDVLVTFQLSGVQLHDIMVFNIEHRPAIQIAGMSGTYKRKPDGSVEFLSIEIGGRALEPQRTYTCAASDFFAGDSEKYLGQEIPRTVDLRSTVFDVVLNALRAAGDITPRVDYPIDELR